MVQTSTANVIYTFFSLRYADIYQKQHNKAIEDVQLYIANPINAYTLVKRLTTDWKNVESLIGTVVSTGIYLGQHRKTPNYLFLFYRIPYKYYIHKGDDEISNR